MVIKQKDPGHRRQRSHRSPASVSDSGPSITVVDASDSGETHSQLQHLLEAIIAVGSELAPSEVLRRITEAATELAGATYGALGVLSEDRTTLSEFVTVGIDEKATAAIGRLPEGHGILGLLIVEPKPLRLPDLSRHPDSYGFPPSHPPMTSFLGVPIIVGGAAFGNLYLTNKRGADQFTQADEDLVVALAAAAASHIETTRLQGQVAALQVVEDRERIARELHDTVIQRLFATGLSLAGVAGRVSDPEVAKRLQTAVDDLDDTVHHIRTTIFELQRPDDNGRSVRRELLDVAADASSSLGFTVATRFAGAIDTLIDGDLADHLVAVTREALSNAVRHSGARSVTLEVDASPTQLTLCVRDNGEGLGGSDGEPSIHGGRGIGNMANRAVERGGTFSLDSGADGGCVVTWQVPTSPSERIDT
jgi:signal transduction histidine kinase